MAALEAGATDFDRTGVTIYGINPGGVDSHYRYCEKKGFSIDLLSDSDMDVTRRYEAVWFAGLFVRRTVYVVDPDQRIIFAERGMPSNQILLQAIEEDKLNHRES